MSAARQCRRQRHKALILCARVGHTGNLPIPSGYQTGDCSERGSAVWVSPHSLAAARASGHAPGFLCNVCVPR
jgi:hypothetical protein